MSPGRRPIQGVHQKRPTSKCQVTSFWLNRRETVKLFKLWIIVRTKTKEKKAIFPFLMPYSCEIDKKWHFHGSNTIKSTISNRFESIALCYQELKFPPSRRANVTGTQCHGLPLHHSRKAFYYWAWAPPKAEVSLADTALLLNRAWLAGLNSTREKHLQ